MNTGLQILNWSDILSFTLMVILVEVSPGPNFVLISKTVMTSGRGCAVANITGFALAFIMHGTLSIFGVSLIMLNSPTTFMFIELAGAAYLFYLGYQALMSGGRHLFAISSPGMTAITAVYVDIERSC